MYNQLQVAQEPVRSKDYCFRLTEDHVGVKDSRRGMMKGIYRGKTLGRLRR